MQIDKKIGNGKINKKDYSILRLACKNSSHELNCKKKATNWDPRRPL